MGNAQLTAVMSSAAADGRKGFKSGLPSPDAIRCFAHATSSWPTGWLKNVTSVRLSAQTSAHYLTLKTVLSNVDRKHPG